MQFGLGPGPQGSLQHKSSHYVYDVRSGAILATHHFVGTAQKLDEELRQRIMRQTHEASTVPIEHLAVLSGYEAPPGEGPLHVDPQSRKLVRKVERTDRRIQA